MSKKKTPVPVAILMSDEEFQEFHRKKEKEKLLDQLIAATNGSFSVKNLGGHKTKENQPGTTKKKSSSEGSFAFTASDANLPSIPTDGKPILSMDDEDFETIRSLASEFGPLSPIDKVTQSVLGEFHLSDAGIREEDDMHYKNLFKKEQAMLNEILSDVTVLARQANKKLKDMEKKTSGYGGVPKTYADLVSAANSLNTTRLHTIDKMAALKKSIVDLEMKRAKEIGTDDGNNKDNIADQFFASIIGNRKQFMESAMANAGYGTPLMNQSTPPPELPYDGYDDDANMSFEGGYSDTVPQNGLRMRSITSPLMQQEDDRELYSRDNTSYDPYGYIHNESRDISICIQRFPDGRLEFVAVDGNGEGVDDYELPDDDLLLSLEIRPLSNFATDEFGRRYRIIDIDANGIDISDT